MFHIIAGVIRVRFPRSESVDVVNNLSRERLIDILGLTRGEEKNKQQKTQSHGLWRSLGFEMTLVSCEEES